eukprot:NODE_4347_length_811_cov_36.548556_g3603_i0.p2 GENE.NODE_4347_length_811_cov_36.548556_g3603_i0~~NODE_4347_length_811_cov_36.548556_g3603_i0.p2  ORF type:complete len:162 (+),score=29.13 NODE_4347_length_811_cov_36.548556_g3603_i0:261-746(+)
MNWDSPNIDPVSKQTIWAEHVRKEQGSIPKPGEFQMSARMTSKGVLPPPCNPRPARFLDKSHQLALMSQKLGIKDADLPQVYKDSEKPESLPAPVLETLKSTVKNPTEKYSDPQTSAQEYGWHAKEQLAPEAAKKFHKPRNQCEMTKFASAAKATAPKPSA